MSGDYTDHYGDGYESSFAARSKIWVEIDWDRDGSFGEFGDDVSDLVRTLASPITATYGRDQSTALAPAVSGQAGFTLDNSDRRFSPRNTASPLYGKLKPARPVRILREVNGSDYVIFRGHTANTPINPDVDSKTVGISAVDAFADFRGQDITTGLHRGIRTGEAIGFILDACGWDADLRDLDPGATVIRWWWEDGTDALTALDKVARSEGPPALLTMSADGEVVFRDRHHRLIDAASLTSQSTWRGDGPGFAMAKGFSSDESWDNIVNSVQASVDVRTPQPEQTVWTSDDTITLTAGETKIVTAVASDPFYEAVTPVAGTDFTLAAGGVTVSLLRTSGMSAPILVTGLSPATVVGLRLRAHPIATAYTVQVSARDPESVEEYGPRTMPGDLPWCDPADAEAVLTTVVAQRAYPLQVASARFMIGRDLDQVPLLGRDLSDRVTVIEDETATNGDFYIESISHTLTGEHDHEVTFGLESAPTALEPILRFDTAGHGFDAGLFSNGLDEAATIARFDTAGHGFDQGVWAL